MAARHLETLGWAIIARNWRCRAGEIDLVARDGNTLVFVEVRTRTARAKVPPRQSVGWSKQRRVARAALHYLRNHNLLRQRTRFDVIAIVMEKKGPVLEHFRGAFNLPSIYW